MIRFGPAGNSDAFYEAGYKHTKEAPKWLFSLGLTAFEYSFGRGVRISENTAAEIAGEAEKYNVQLSIHAPYFINLAGEGEEKYQKNLMYLRQCAEAAAYFRCRRIVFHPGACAKMDRSIAFANVYSSLERIVSDLRGEGFNDIILCPETMGKINQIADLDEVCRLCEIDDIVYPAIDFGHLNARGRGNIKGYDDYLAIIEKMYNEIGSEKTDGMHVHFSRIEFTGAGEKMHHTFEDKEFGPDPEPLCRLFAERRMCPTVICESKGTQALDAKYMLDTYSVQINFAE